MKRTPILVALALAAAASGALAQFYRWVDEKGVTHYSASPPPGQKAQEIRILTPPPKASAEPARNPLAVVKPAVGSRPSVAVIDDRNRLLGSWGTAPAAPVQISVVFAPLNRSGGAELLVSQRWVRGDKMSFKSEVPYRISIGGGGRGLLETDGMTETDLPAKITYVLDGNALLLGASDGNSADMHRLNKLK